MSRHPNAVVLPEPINVSPLIRFSRWTALGLGIVWGAYRLRQIKEYHADIRDWQHEKEVAAKEEAAKKKKWASKDEMRYLMNVINLPFEEGVAQFGVEDLFREE
ncbi:ATP synthase subunit e, mitochondrial [Aphelenchoides besseyi]|nr:ATP synthase subunit e, mitochondrial [Aphelenchoides besseyi]KAI6200277.1 ATP synthase subunit e, mitochondrial [Aphelenchoides besseyi]